MIIDSKRSRPIQLNFRVDEKEYQFIQSKMDQAGIKNFSLFARLMLLTGEIQVIDFPTLKQLRLEVNKIGVNINQIAKKVNENDYASYSDIQLCQEVIEELQLEVSRIINQEVKQYVNVGGNEDRRSETIQKVGNKIEQAIIDSAEGTIYACY